jgi:hypothetical protein
MTVSITHRDSIAIASFVYTVCAILESKSVPYAMAERTCHQRLLTILKKMADGKDTEEVADDLYHDMCQDSLILPRTSDE